MDTVDYYLQIKADKIDPTTVSDDSVNYVTEDKKTFNPNEYLSIASPLEKVGSREKRSSTEGRARSLFKRVRNLVNEIVYNDVLVKGGGGKEVELIREIENEHGEIEETVVTNTVTSTGRRIINRFIPGRIRGITDLNFGSSNIKNSNNDAAISEALSSKGLRTRVRVFAGKLKGSVRIPTEGGLKKINEVYGDDSASYPAIEIWLMRCSYRVRDVIKSLGNSLGIYSIISYTSKFTYDEENRKIIRPTSTQSGIINDLKSKELKEYFDELREIISIRAEVDEDERFRVLSERTGENKEFFESYIDVFATILGEQAGIMFKEGAFSRDRLLNDQNVTLLAEIVDNDVTEFSEVSKKDHKIVFEQLTLTFNHLTKLMLYLAAAGQVSDSFDPITIFASYVIGLRKILQHSNEYENLKKLIENYDTSKIKSKEAQDLENLINIQKDEVEQSKKDLEQKRRTLNNGFSEIMEKHFALNIELNESMLRARQKSYEKFKYQVQSPLKKEESLIDKRKIFNSEVAIYYFIQLVLGNIELH